MTDKNNNMCRLIAYCGRTYPLLWCSFNESGVVITGVNGYVVRLPLDYTDYEACVDTMAAKIAELTESTTVTY